MAELIDQHYARRMLGAENERQWLQLKIERNALHQWQRLLQGVLDG